MRYFLNYFPSQLIGTSCLPPHGDSRCCFTMMPIFFIPLYKCPLCQCVAHRETKEEISMFFCPYCDVPMLNVPVESKKLDDMAKEFDIDLDSGVVKSVCFADCLGKEDMEKADVEDLEAHEIELVIFSDSDDGEDDGEDGKDKLRTLYFKMAQCSLTEVIACDNGGNRHEDGEEEEVEEGPSKKLKTENDSGGPDS